MSEMQRLGEMQQIIHGYVRSQLVGVAAKLGIADRLGDGAKDAAELAPSTGIEERRLHRLLRGWVGAGLLEQRQDGRFALSPLGQTLRTDVPSSLHTVAVRALEIDYPAWGGLLRAVETGEVAFESVFGVPFFEHVAKDPRQSLHFNRVMASIAEHTASSVIAAYDFSAARTVLDVGGGSGALLSAVLAANPHLTGMLLDLPSAVAEAPARLSAAGVAARCEVVGASFFDRIPDGADLHLLQHVIHNWDDDACVRILSGCRRALPATGALLIIEQVMPERVDASTPTPGFDLLMMVLVGGVERTEAEFRALLARSGFALRRIVPAGMHRILEATPS